MIDKVQCLPLKRLPDDRGTIFHMLKRTDPIFQEFGEIYFTSLYPGIIKAWHLHQAMDLNYACIVGEVKVVLFDDRPDSITRGKIEEYFIGDNNYSLLHVPHGVINGMQGQDNKLSIVANCATLPHDPDEMIRFDIGQVPYDW